MSWKNLALRNQMMNQKKILRLTDVSWNVTKKNLNHDWVRAETNCNEKSKFDYGAVKNSFRKSLSFCCVDMLNCFWKSERVYRQKIID